MNIGLKSSFFSLGIFAVTLAQAQGKQNFETATKALINRTLPGYSTQFTINTIPTEAGKNDVFILSQKNGTIALTGNNGVALASAFHYYLKKYTHSNISWSGNQVKVPKILPLPTHADTVRTPYKYRYYFNYCTFNYSMSWWNWERWEKEIDFMAMNGINLPLAITGQNYIWKKVYKKLGFSDDNLATFFSGPAYFNWFWMGNLDGWGGPLSDSFMEKQIALEKKILARQRELGMQPILPAFTGHVPASFKDKFPQSKVIKTEEWNGFAPTYILDPMDPMFDTIGQMFIKEETATLGTNHLYSADTFNENDPPTKDSTYLSNISAKVFKAMQKGDPDAKWIMQGWLFWSSRKFWGQNEIKALLNPIPNDKMIILDLYTESHPQWENTSAYYGKPWIWCMLNNFGGIQALCGRMDEIAEGPSRDRQSPHAGNMAGIGLTSEAIEQNPALYEMFLDNVWHPNGIQVQDWLKDYATRRYGVKNPKLEEAWNILHTTVYTDKLMLHGGPKAMLVARPTLERQAKWVDISKQYNPKDLVPAWKNFYAASTPLKSNLGFQYDFVNLTRQVLADYSDSIHFLLAEAYRNKDYHKCKILKSKYLQLFDDIDTLLSTRHEFLVGKWIKEAREYGKDITEKNLLEQNARNLITLWGDKNSPLHEYANKQWNGIMRDFYKKRWQEYFNVLDKAIISKQTVDQKTFEESIKNFEWNWVISSKEKYRSIEDNNNAIAIAQKMFIKYYKDITTLYQ